MLVIAFRGLCADPGQRLLTPRVRLLQVDPGAEEGARVQRVRLAPDGVALGGLREQLVAQERRERGVRLAGGGAGALQLLAQRGGQFVAVDRRVARERGEEAVRPGVVAGLLDAGLDLAAGAHVTARGSQAQRFDVAADRARHRGQPAGDVRPLVEGLDMG